jgi:hypothetical protein
MEKQIQSQFFIKNFKQKEFFNLNQENKKEIVIK